MCTPIRVEVDIKVVEKEGLTLKDPQRLAKTQTRALIVSHVVLNMVLFLNS
jgi:hypothetical protein